MRIVTALEDGSIHLEFMWLPTWLGMNPVLVEKVERSVLPLFVGREATEEVLEEAHEKVLDFIAESFQELPGLRDLLDALKFVRDA